METTGRSRGAGPEAGSVQASRRPRAQRRWPVLLPLLLCLSAAPLAAAPGSSEGLLIASITIERHDVFETGPPNLKRLYRAADGFHTTTREAVISRELLFAVGEPLDQALIDETERNLRRLPFLRRAEAKATVNASGTVDVLVRTYDSWTLEVATSFKRAGGYVSWRTGLAEHNLLGQGKTVSVLASRDGSATSRSFAWKDPQLLGRKHLECAMAALWAPESRSYSIALGRPFYASIARAALGAAASYVESPVPTFSGERATGSAQKRVGEASISYGVALATSTRRTRHLIFGLSAHRAEFRPILGPAPSDERLGYLQVSADWERLAFVKRQRIQRLTRDEDYNLGFGLFPSLAWAPNLRGLSAGGSRILPKLAARKGFAWADQLLLLNSAYASSYVNGGNGNRTVSLGASYFVRVLERQTLAFNSAVDFGWRLDPAAPLTLGELNGLRGYGLSHFVGNRRWLFNIEDRIFLFDELWRLVDVGAVAFYDSGYVWPASRPLRLADLKSSVGAGLRLAPSRSSSNSPVRIDVAYALGDNRSRSRWSLSILAGQAFGP